VLTKGGAGSAVWSFLVGGRHFSAPEQRRIRRLPADFKWRTDGGVAQKALSLIRSSSKETKSSKQAAERDIA
jgi:hypothetical protein